MLPYLIAMLPTHTAYIEVFGGSGTFLLNKPRSKVEVYNDINTNIVNFFRVLRDTPNELLRLLKLTPYARDEFLSCKRNISFEKNDVEKARKFFVKHQQSHAGRGTDYGFAITKNGAETFSNKIEKLKNVAMRLKHVQIENRDFKFMIERYAKNKDVFVYLDPPYLPETRVSNNDYTFEMTEKDHVELLKLVKKSPAKFLISGYDSGLYNKYLKNWDKKVIDVACFCSTKFTDNKKPRRKEVMWYNYKLPDDLPAGKNQV